MASFSFARRSGARDHDPAPGGDVASPAPAAELAPGHGPGWYESSWELRCGLEVVEGQDAVPPPDDAGT